MAKVSAVLPVAPKVIGSSSVKSRRNSIAKGSPANIEDAVVPHYRRASIGSCHDFCKYGRKQASEVKEKHSVSSRVRRNPLSQSSEADVNGVKACVANRRASIGSIPPRKASMVKLRESFNSEPKKHEMPTKLADSPKQGRSEVSVAKKKTSVVKLKTVFHKKSHTADLPLITRQGNSSISAKLVETSSKPTLGLVRDASKSTVEPVETSKSIAEQPVETSLKSTTEQVEASSESIMDLVGNASISMVEPVKDSSKATLERVETSSKLNVKPVETSSTLTLEPMVTSSESIMDPVGILSISMVEPVECSPKSTSELVQTSSKLIVKPVETSSIFTVEPMVTSSKSSTVPVGILSISTVETVECSSKSTPELVETPSELIAEPVETSSILTVEPMVTSSRSSMVPVGIPSISTVESVECTSKSTLELMETSSELIVKSVETSSTLTVGPMVTLSESIMEQVGSSSKSCEECAMAASKPTAEPVEVLPKSIAKKEDVSSKSTVKKVRALSKSTPKKLEASPKTSAKKVGASPKSTAQKVETLSKSSIKKLETTSKSIAKKKPAAKMVETSLKSADKKEEMSMKSSAKKVVTSTKSTARAGISSESVVNKVVTVKNVEASSTSNSMVQTLSKPTPLKAKQMKLPGKPVAPLKSNSITVNSVSSLNPSEGSNGQSNSKLKMVKQAASLKVAARKVSTPSRAALPSKSSLDNNGVVSINARKHRSLKIASHLKNQSRTRKYEHKKPGNDAVKEKILYVIKMESGNKSLPTDRDAGNDVESSPQSSSPPKFSVNLEGELMKNGEALEVKDIGEPLMVGIVSSEDKASQMSTLNFRRGKLVELQSEETSPRRLKFRRATGFGENAMVSADSLRRSFKRRYDSGIDRMSTPTGPEKVVLRRQGTRGKRDGHGLFNNVIEETANKLAETRKSKVKALVGAFETIISLQEKKPVAKTVS